MVATQVTPSAGRVVFNPDEDAYVSEARPTVTFNSGTLWVDTIDGYRLNAFLRFGVTGVEGTVTSARLRLYTINATIDGPDLFVTDSAWTEGEITWATQPPAPTSSPKLAPAELAGSSTT